MSADVYVHVGDRERVDVTAYPDGQRVVLRLGLDARVVLFLRRDGLAHLRDVLTQALVVLDGPTAGTTTDPTTADEPGESTDTDGFAEGGSFPMEGAA